MLPGWELVTCRSLKHRHACWGSATCLAGEERENQHWQEERGLSHWECVLTGHCCVPLQAGHAFAPPRSCYLQLCRRWYIDSLVAVLLQAGPYVQEEACRALVVIIQARSQRTGCCMLAVCCSEKGRSVLQA